ncbi:MAG: extracellular solute-binding protein [Clostridiales bacterium]|nr:extracellular solute-binding protein [Clostridiales bacterium]
MKTISKKLRFLITMLVSIFAIITIFPLLNGVVEASAETTKTITVFSWEDYIDLGDEEAEEDYLKESILDIFEQKTGIHVNYQTFATNEEMYNEIKKDPTACDIICPSEYMIMKMRDEGLIKPYQAPANYVKYGSPYIKSVFDDIGLNLDDGTTYAVGYMWGTMGYIYNMEKHTEEDLKHWSSILDDKFKGKVTIKDSIRDTYIMAIAMVYEDELLSLDKTAPDYTAKVQEIFNRAEPDDILKVESKLQEIRGNLYGFEVDSGKSDIVTGKIDVNFAWSGDAVAAIDEGDGVGKTLGYAVPEEGSNVWFDGFVLTKEADTENSLEFIDFICRPDIAIRNMDYIGYVSCIRGDEVFDYVCESYAVEDGEYSVDLSYFFDDNFMETGVSNAQYVVKTDEIGRMFSAQYADWKVIQRCAVMENFGNDTLVTMNAMWSRVKLITLSPLAIILIVVAIVLCVALIIVYKYKDKIFKTKIPKKKSTAKPNEFKVISKEEIR